ncbi:hypothetical protein ACH5RR_031491 [Cinchona calisaya]|uniref:Uncharacterized protein n=1 Tax=Cinchona calisaya TaxID=153742 RepID=A0ABD2YJF8_9GENT
MRLEKLKKTVTKARKALDRYNRDFDYQFLYDNVAYLFAELLKADTELYNAGELYKISLASKWCPSLDSSYDRATLICESIARKVFPREIYTHIMLISTIGNGLRSILRVRSGKSTIAAGALLPQEIINSLEAETGPEVAELQWKRMVDDLAQKGKLTNCMATCDVSGSMSGIPMEVSVALGLLISELSENPWKGKLITFSANPQLHRIEGESLGEKTQFIRDMEWGVNTDFQRNSVATPVPSDQEGVALVNEFSKNLVTLFLEEGGIMTPEAVMLQTISGEEYQKLVIYD